MTAEELSIALEVHVEINCEGGNVQVLVESVTQRESTPDTEASLPEIGRQFGGKHHTTVLHSVDKIEGLRKNDKDLNRLLNKLTEQLGA